MSVRDEIAVHARQREKFAQQFGVPFRWLRYPCRFTREPSIYLPPRIANRFGMFEYARSGLVTSRRKASRLTHGRPTGPEPFNC